MATAKKKFKIEPVNGKAPIEVSGTNAKFDEGTGRVQIYDGEDLVASYVNVNFSIIV